MIFNFYHYKCKCSNHIAYAKLLTFVKNKLYFDLKDKSYIFYLLKDTIFGWIVWRLNFLMKDWILTQGQQLNL